VDQAKQLLAVAGTRIAVDIGSTVVKVARVRPSGELVAQQFYPRDFDAGIARQVQSILDRLYANEGYDEVLVCSSANGGLRVGIVSLTPHFSGAVVRNQVLLAGANPVFLHDFDDESGHAGYVDVLLVAGGIDCEESGPLEQRLKRFRPERYRYGTLLYAGNKHLAGAFTASFPQAAVVSNPLAEGLAGRVTSVFEALRRAYLDDLVHKEGVSELRPSLSGGIRPTPEVVNRGFHRAILNGSTIRVVGACVLLDIGGATTDLHYSVEIVRDDSEAKPLPGSSVARYVFTDLGIVASRDSLLLQMRTHPRLYDFLQIVLSGETREVYRLLREGEYDPSPELLSYGCLFLALDRFAQGRGPGLPTADLSRLAQIILTGGAAQALSVDVVGRITDLLMPDGGNRPVVLVDRQYQIWIEGITWSVDVPV
jgi:hypothetical protein